MPSNFPASLDALNNPTPTTSLNDVNFLHSDQHANANNAIEAIEGVIGVTNSTDPNSLEYRLALKAPIASPTFTGTVGGITASMVGAPSGSGTSSGSNTGDQTATTVANTPAGSIAAITVQAAINELDTEKAPLASPTFSGTVGGITAAMVVNTPAGNIAAVTTQAAINELDTEKLSTNGVGSDLTLARIAGSTYSTVQHFRNNMASSGVVAGALISDAGGATINVTSGSCTIRPTTSHLSTLYFADFPANNGIAIPANTIRYVGIEYNAGTPIITIRAADDFDYMTNFPVGTVTNEGGILHLHTADRHYVADAPSHTAERFEQTFPFKRDEITGGLILGETGTRNITMSAGAVWEKLTRLPITAFNSSTGGTFDIYYRNGAGSFTKVAAATQWPNLQYDNNTGTLANLANNKYGTLWFYLEPDDSMLIMLYGRVEHGSIAAAEAEAPPATTPNRITVGGKLIGRLVFGKSGAVASSISSVFATIFSSAGASAHSNLSNLDYASAGHTGFVADVTKGAANGVASLDANALIPVSQLPPAAIERLVVVADQAVRYALTIASVQNGDTVKQNDTGEMWYVIDQTNLGNAAGYAVYTAGSASAVALGGVTGLGTGVATFLATPTLANFNTALSDANVATGGGTATGTNTGDQTATTVANTPAGSIAATTVQAALNELDTEKAALAGSASQAFSCSTLTSASGIGLVSANVAGDRSMFGGENVNTGASGVISGLLQNSIGSLFLRMYGSGYTPSGIAAANAGALYSDTAGGLAVGAINGSGTLRLFGGGSSIGVFSSTGLAVTGSITSTLGANFATSSGNVGIGTVSPGSKLEIVGTTTVIDDNTYANLSVQTSDAMAIDKGGSIGLGGVLTGSVRRNFGFIWGRKENATDNNRAGYLSFGTAKDSTPFATEWMRITSGGNVGIGTTDPGAYKLNVNGNVNVTGSITSTAGFYTTTGNTGSIASATPTTIFTPSVRGTYLVACCLNAIAGYNAAATVVFPGGGVTAAIIQTLTNGGNSTITLSGNAVQVAQYSGGNQALPWSYIFIPM